ncbi:MlaD family protein [Sphingomonas jatrophae]|uniref:Phospholipid/cholesterol/gamma-HCH transport system substrate-binding protein n=1 Tax=Sphingomonas jatrophae TaxID=1166337 RepID=A0A1I6LLY1_9SPHN|nr:MlaD family protein [Sphingomonas jatrophae]SFS04484.1 phospholipid/cholesterol/gamma-HCH transport system substrate-binding protein [Sphingomonas jatrophae]
MENRSNNVLVGSVVLGLTLLTVVFLIWIAGFSGGSDQKFDIFFKTSVDGLAKGSSVTFAGVPVGKIEDINIMPQSPEFVQVRISVKEDVPVLQGTTATIAGVGFTGVSQINLDGAIKGQPPITDEGPYGVPVIPTKPGALGELLNSAPQLLDKLSTLTERLGQMLDDRNQNSIRNILANMDKLSQSLAGQGPEIRATLAETRIAIRSAGVAADQIGQLAATTNGIVARDVQPAAANLNKAIASAQRSMETLDAAIGDARPGLRTFSQQTVPNANALIRNLNEMSEALTAVAQKLDRGGVGGVIGGGRLPDYEPGRK